MTVSRNVSRHVHVELTRVQSMGGPLVVVPVSVLHRWGGCTMDGVIVGAPMSRTTTTVPVTWRA